MTDSFDEQWFARLRAVSGQADESIWFQDHARIHGEERDLFLDNEIENPRFIYSGKMNLEKIEGEALALQADIEVSTTHAVVIDLYQRKIHNHRVRCALIKASQDGDDKAFYRLSAELYGKPQKKYFAYVARRVMELCKEKNAVAPEAAKRLRKIVSKITHVDEVSVDMLPPIVFGKTLTKIEEVKDIFTETIERFGITGWTLQIDESGTRTRFSVNPFRQIVYIPAAKQLFNRSKTITDVHMKALAEHEVGVHARRAHEATQTRLQLLEIGLDSYLVGEEGLAGYVQQQIEGAEEFYGFDRYFAACLAVGMDGEKRDFRAVFGAMTDYYALRFADNDGFVGTPVQAAWEVCVRIFRGTTGTQAGYIYTKDIVYMEGNIAMWDLLTERPHVFESLFLGKFNPFLKRHITSLQTLEILKEW